MAGRAEALRACCGTSEEIWLDYLPLIGQLVRPGNRIPVTCEGNVASDATVTEVN
jgi:hypothetical protein